jgi:hypothetical protein
MQFDTEQWAVREHLDLRIDNRRRVRIRRGRRDGAVTLEALLVSLPHPEREREELLSRTLLRVTAGAASHVGTVVSSADGEQLLLQAEAGGSDADAFAQVLETFLNEIDYWIAATGPRS